MCGAIQMTNIVSGGMFLVSSDQDRMIELHSSGQHWALRAERAAATVTTLTIEIQLGCLPPNIHKYIFHTSPVLF